MFPSRFEATPVPAPGSGIPPYELSWIFRQAREIAKARTLPQIIDLTTEDDDNEPQFYDQSNSSAMAARFESLLIKARDKSDQSQSFANPLPNTQASASQHIPQLAKSPSPRSEDESTRSKKRKESESGEDGDDVHSWSIKRRLRPRRQVVYDEDAASDGDIVLDHPALEENMTDLIEKDTDNKSDVSYDSDASDTEIWEVKRVVAEKRGPRIHEFLLEWIGSDEQNWISAKRCECEDLIAEFRAIPRVPADTQYLAVLERNRLRRADNARRTGAARPKNVRVPGPGSFRNPKTGRFEKRRITPPQPRLEQEIVDSDTEDELDLDNEAIELKVTRSRPARTPSRTPSLDHCSASINGSPASMSSSSHPSNLQPVNPDETVVWVRKTPIADGESPSEPSCVKGKGIQRQMQTATVTWIRDTPGFEDEQASFPRSDGTVVFTSTKTKTLRTSSNPSFEAAGLTALKSMPSMVPHTIAGQCGFTSIKSRSSPTISQQTTRWTVVKSNPIPPSWETHPQASGITNMKPNATQTAACSPSLPAKSDKYLNHPQQKLLAAAQGIQLHSRSSSGAFNVAATSPYPQHLFTSHIGVLHHETSVFRPMPPPPLEFSPRIDHEIARRQSDISVQSAKPLTFTSPHPVAGVTHRGQAISLSSPTKAFRLKRPKSKAKQLLTSSKRSANTMTPASKPDKPSQPPEFSWSPPSSPVESTNAKRLSGLTTKVARPAMSTTASPIESPSKSSPAQDTGARSPRHESPVDISDLLELALSVAAATRSTSCIPPPSVACTTSVLPASMDRISQPVMAARLPRVQRRESRNDTSADEHMRHLQQRKSGNTQNSAQDGVRKAPYYHGFKVDMVKNSNGSHRTSSATATPDTMRQSRSPIRREPLNQRPKQRKVVQDRFTRAIEDEIASDVGPHVISKKVVGAVLSNASVNASRRPAVMQHIPKISERSPSVSTKWFVAARNKEKEDALARAPKGLRPELNRDFGPWYPQGLCAAAKREESDNLRWEFKRLGLNYSRDTPLPSIES
ncbi:hypothetical protein N431DRAFT_340566 [Stipitochalara longipes BDJ]|nr:hypothetical protein N431DRAFT_340566 [Stipitochalara longipes BDJ]